MVVDRDVCRLRLRLELRDAPLCLSKFSVLGVEGCLERGGRRDGEVALLELLANAHVALQVVGALVLPAPWAGVKGPMLRLSCCVGKAMARRCVFRMHGDSATDYKRRVDRYTIKNRVNTVINDMEHTLH